MTILKQYNDKRRIVFYRHWFYGWRYYLQVKKWYGWYNVTGQYPAIMKNSSAADLVHQLEYQEGGIINSPKELGLDMVKKFNQ